jgi:hypothetical protein
MEGCVANPDLDVSDPRHIGPYRLMKRLDAGGLGRAYLAESLAGQTVVLRVLPQDLVNDPGYRSMLERDVAAAARISGPFTAAIVGVQMDGPQPWLATEYVQGTTLAQAVADAGPMAEAQLLALGTGLAAGLVEIHAAGVVHGDLKPSNVILASNGPRIADFGIASETVSSKLASSATIIGNQAYISPEQARREPTGPASDIFSLGGVLTFAATGEQPFQGDTAAGLLYQVVTREPDLSGVPRSMRSLVASCLAKDPVRRPLAFTLRRSFYALQDEADAALHTNVEVPPGLEGFGNYLVWMLATRAAELVDDVYASGLARPSRKFKVADGRYLPTPSLIAWLVIAARRGEHPATLLRLITPRLLHEHATLRAVVDRAMGGYPLLFRAEWLRGIAGLCELTEPELRFLDTARGRPGHELNLETLRRAVGGRRRTGRRPGGQFRLRRSRASDYWPDDGVSDEDYWASVAADRPLTASDSPLDSGSSDFWPDDGVSDEDYWASVAASRPLFGPVRDVRLPAPPDFLQPPGSHPPGGGPGGDDGSGWESAGGQPAGRFLTGSLPEQAPAGARISLLVRVTRTAVAWASASLKDFPVSPAGARVTITVSAPGLLALGDLDQDLVVPFAADSEPVRFGFLAGRVGLHRVEVRAFAGGTCLGELALQISVETGVAVEEGRPHAALMTGLAAEPGEVTLQVSRTAGGGYSFQLLSEALYPVVLIDRLAGDPAQVVAKIAAELRMMSRGQSPYASATHARNRLRALGAELWADVVPEEIRRQFWAQRDRIKLFTIASDMDTMPWELVYPVDLGSEYGFLVEQFPVVRRVYGQDRARFLRLGGGAAFIVPPNSPANALDEVAAVRGILPADVADRGVAAGLAEVVELLDAMPSVLHFAGHNAFTDEAGSVIRLGGGPLCPDDLSYYRQKRAFAGGNPLVFLNGCRTAGEIPGFAQMNGWAEKFMGAGAGAFIGSLWAVRSSSAKVFAEEFYRELVTLRQPLGTASLRARQAIAADLGDPTWLAYTIYGNPLASVEHNPNSTL